MRDGVLRGMRALLAENGRLVANGARRTEGEINELSKVVYSTCNLCKDDPTIRRCGNPRPNPSNLEHKKIEYEDALLEMYGIPVAYFPYIWHADPSVKRASGLLIPATGYSKYLGAFVNLPYYWVIDDQQDLVISPWLTTKDGPRLELDYRIHLNEGQLTVDTSVGEIQGRCRAISSPRVGSTTTIPGVTALT